MVGTSPLFVTVVIRTDLVVAKLAEKFKDDGARAALTAEAFVENKCSTTTRLDSTIAHASISSRR